MIRVVLNSSKERWNPYVLLLAEASLSHLDGIELLDRAELRRVLDEQELAVASLADPEQAMRIGKLLRVDVYGVLEIDPRDANLIGLVVFDAATSSANMSCLLLGDPSAIWLITLPR